MDTCQDQQGLGYALANHRGGLGFGPNSGLMILFQSLESADVMKSIIWLFLCNWLVAGRGYWLYDADHLIVSPDAKTPGELKVIDPVVSLTN